MNFYHVREESFANLITWKILNLTADLKVFDDIKYVGDYMQGQSASYRFALKIKQAKRIGGWVWSKTSQVIDRYTAFCWMDEAETYENGSYHEYEDFCKSEYSIRVPWAFEYENWYKYKFQPRSV